eukprot:gene30734-37134_t
MRGLNSDRNSRELSPLIPDFAPSGTARMANTPRVMDRADNLCPFIPIYPQIPSKRSSSAFSKSSVNWKIRDTFFLLVLKTM